MKFQNKVIQNASWIIGCKIIQAVLNLIISMITARYLGPSNYGLINYAASMVAFVLPISYLGLDNILVQEAINQPKEEGVIFGTSIILSLTSSLLCMAGLVSFVAFVNFGEKDTILVCGLHSLILLVQTFELIQYWFQTHYISKFVSVITLCAYCVISVYRIFLLITEKSIYWFAVSNALDHLMISVALLLTYKKLGGQKLSFSASMAKRMLGKSKYYIVSGMMVTVFAQTDKIMLKLMIDTSATGFYSAAVSCAGISSFVVSAIIASMRPAILEAHGKSKDAFFNSMRILYAIIIFLSLTQSIVMTVFAKFFIVFLYGESYYPAISVLRLIVWYTTFSYMGAARDVWILAEEKQNVLWFINLSGALLNVILNLIMIPLWGSNGAALASFLTQFFTNFVLGFLLKPIRSNNRIIMKAFNVKLFCQDIKNLVMNK